MPRTLLDLVHPQEEVLSSTLDESIFAANLTDALNGNAPPVYSSPETFFARTHPSRGLVEVLRMSLGRLSGILPDEPPILRIDTNLGGGKTHNLIALCHICRGGLSPALMDIFLGPRGDEMLSGLDTPRVATFVGTDWGVARHDRTVWGSLASQLDADLGYEILREDDELRTAPGTNRLKRILGSHPNLIVIDEIAHYLEKAQAVKVGQSTLARQTLAFIMSLCEAAAQSPHTVVVITTTQESSVFEEGTEEVLRALSRLGEIVGRQAHLIQPATETDIPGVMTRRLFAQVDRSDTAEIAQAYQDALQRYENLVGGLPQALYPRHLAKRMHETWPYHPELVSFLDKRLSTNPHFQRTRGALRLLARAVRLLWSNADAVTPLAIHPHHLDLADDDIIRPQLTRALQRSAMDPVARADVANRHEPSRAGLIDQDNHRQYAQRASIVCFLESLTQTASNPSQGSILGTALMPDDDPNRMQAAWDRLRQEAWYLHEERGGYVFKTEPSLTKMIQEHTEQVRPSDARTKALALLEEMFSTTGTRTSGGVFRVRKMYLNEKAPDAKDEVSLCLFSWSQFPGEQGIMDPAEVPPEIIRHTWERTDMGGLRQFRNRMVFVAPDAQYFNDMLDAVRRHLALETLARDDSLLTHLGEEARQTLSELRGRQHLMARVGVANIMSLVWFPRDNQELQRIQMTVQSTSRAERNQMDVVYEALDHHHKWLSAGSAPMDPAVLRQQLGLRLEKGFTVTQVEEFMAQSGGSRILLDPHQLTQLVRHGVRNEEWEYQSPQGTWQIQTQFDTGFDVVPQGSLHPVGTAPVCPKCHQLECDCDKACPDVYPKCGQMESVCVVSPPSPTRYMDDGSPGASFSAIVQNALSDNQALQRVRKVCRIQIHWGAEEQNALSCLMRTSQLMSKVRLLPHTSSKIALELDTVVDDERIALTFSGGERHSHLPLDAAKDILRQGSGSVFQVTVEIEFTSPRGLDESWVQVLHDALAGTPVSFCTATLEVEQDAAPQEALSPH